jgi:hypothetical protein
MGLFQKRKNRKGKLWKNEEFCVWVGGWGEVGMKQDPGPVTRMQFLLSETHLSSSWIHLWVDSNIHRPAAQWPPADFCWRHRPASMVVQVPTGFDQQKCLRGRVGGESLGAHPARLDSVPDFLVRWRGLLLMEVLPWALHHCWDRMPPRTRMPAAHGSCCSCHPSCPLSPPESDSLQPCTLLPKGPWLVPQRCYIVTLVSVA